MENKIIEVDGVKYQVILCPKCKSELRFKMHGEKRRVYGVCAKCMHPFDVEVDKA